MMKLRSRIGLASLVLLVTGGLSNALCTDPLAGKAGTCWVTENETVTIPCGDLELNEHMSLTYYARESGVTLATSIREKLRIKISPSDVKNHVCCRANNSTSAVRPHEQCYQILETYAPKRTGLIGYEEPVFGQPFQLECPLAGSPPTLYYWQKYDTIDMSTEASFTADVEFSDGGRAWYVDVVTAQHSGMYVCSALNERGEEKYVDTINFFLSVSGCPYHAPDVSIQVTPTEKTHYSKGEDVQLTCTAVAVERHEQPFWWVERDGNTSLCSSPEFSLNNSFEVSACRWKTVLTVPDFTAEKTGSYSCGWGSNSVNKTLHLEDGSEDSYHVLVSLLVLLVSTLWTLKQCKHPLASTVDLQHTEEPPREGFLYDAFISAHDEAKDFVFENILQPLESDWTGSTPYKLCWHSRDFIPGIPIMEQIARSISESRKVIFVFSEHFSQSEFCRAELQLAMNRYLSSNTRCIVPVALADSYVPEQVRQSITYLPTLSAAEGDVAGRIARVMGHSTAVDSTHVQLQE